jgi:hypothetical protein
LLRSRRGPTYASKRECKKKSANDIDIELYAILKGIKTILYTSINDLYGAAVSFMALMVGDGGTPPVRNKKDRSHSQHTLAALAK